MEPINKLTESAMHFYNSIFPSVDIEAKFKEIQKNFPMEETELKIHTLTSEAFKGNLLKLIGLQKEDEAIELVMRTYLIVYK